MSDVLPSLLGQAPQIMMCAGAVLIGFWKMDERTSIILGSYHESNNSFCKGSMSDFVLSSFSHEFLAGD